MVSACSSTYPFQNLPPYFDHHINTASCSFDSTFYHNETHNRADSSSSKYARFTVSNAGTVNESAVNRDRGEMGNGHAKKGKRRLDLLYATAFDYLEYEAFISGSFLLFTFIIAL
jgi:hypothetical protein